MSWSTRDIVVGNGLQFAPLAGVSDPSVRVLCRYFGAGPTMSEMVSAHGISVKRMHLLTDQLELLEMEGPHALQIVGSDPQIMANVAQLAVEHGADAVNLNFACPARKIVKGGKGCAMMKTPELAGTIMRAVRGAVEVPVTVKIRSGWSNSTINAVEISKLAEDCGMDSVTLHPRTREQAFGGRSDWSLIRKTVRALSIPVIGNGDIKDAADARRMFEETGCAGIMVGRGALGRPWLFAEIIEGLRGTDFLGPQNHTVPDLSEFSPAPFSIAKLAEGDTAQRRELIRLQIALAAKVKPDKIVAKEVRKHVIWYARGLPNASPFRASIHTATDIAALQKLVDGFFG